MIHKPYIKSPVNTILQFEINNYQPSTKESPGVVCSGPTKLMFNDPI